MAIQTSKLKIQDSKLGKDALALLLLSVFALVLCAPMLAGRVPVATDTISLWAPWSEVAHAPTHNLGLADSAHQALAWAVFERRSLADGEWPLWDPYSFSGSPFAANAQNQLYYPLTWLLWVLPLSGAIQARALFNILLAGWGMYTFSRVLGVSRAGALVAGLAFSGSGMSQTAIDAPFVSSVYCWLPWMLAATDKALRLRSWRWTAFAALACGLQAVAGNLQWVVYAYFAVACWVGWRAIQLWWAGDNVRRGTIGGLLSLAGRGALILVGGAALAAVHLAPFFELLGLASRAGVKTSSNSDPLVYLLRLLTPNFFGNPVAIPDNALGSTNLWYAGVIPLLLALLAIGFWLTALANKRLRESQGFPNPQSSVPFWASLGALSVLVAYGIGPFLYARWLPGLNATLPIRIGYLFIASISVLAGLEYDGFRAGVQLRYRIAVLLAATIALVIPVSIAGVMWANGSTWNSPPNSAILKQLQASDLLRAAILIASVFAALVLLAFRDRTPKTDEQNPLTQNHALEQREGSKLKTQNVLSGLIIAIVALDMWSMTPGYSTFVTPDNLLPVTPAVSWLRNQPGQWRMMGVDNPVPSFVPNTHLLFDLATVDGYDSLHPRNYDEFWGVAQPDLQPGRQRGPYASVFVRPQVYTSTLAALLNVKYVMATGVLSAPVGFRRVYTGEVNIYENANALPRAFLIAQEGARFLTLEATLQRLGAPDFDPRRELLLPSTAESAKDVGNPQSSAPGDVRIVSYRRNSVTLDADVTNPAWLVLGDNNYPGWRATVDGQERQIYTADHILRAVPLDKGRHRVVFSFQPSLFLPSVLLSALALFTVIAVIILGNRAIASSGADIDLLY